MSMTVFFGACIGAVIGYNMYKSKAEKAKQQGYEQPSNQNNEGQEYRPMNLGSYNHYLDPDEICVFQQEDVAWYGYTYNHRDQMYLQTSANVGNVRLSSISEMHDGEPDYIWNVRAEGTLYVTNKKVLLYDKGFSNVWTQLSIEGDYPEQVLGFHREDITDVRQITLNNGSLRGLTLSTGNDQCILAPSQRKYSGRRTPIMNEYKSLEELGRNLIISKAEPEIEALKRKIDNIVKEREELEKKHNL
ncbi:MULTISPECIES: hypothetical protein [Bacillus cereus group]|uniref:hypothetical protein n=1 Tax=Bacillus cereus group TaxID=86661 RepID=UPI001F383043|nr:hypothetical protein [Bacillus cereus]MDA1521057.1 hypothetical protein [Bacillus cereus]BCC09503.1 hypothetical protein BCM0060_p2169 [Bacillus cereus]BCC16491.1 hypothetical protein BCM0075_1261 [Bacillus cereus]BCC50600.1 hypothetical protein BCJMU02_p2194 [Bacillus cereus]BCD08935.1 hypothetical protein BC30052_p2217 [Bacillus cereus]